MTRNALKGRYREAPLKTREVQFTVPTRYVAIELVAPQGVAERRVTMWDGVEIHDVHQISMPKFWTTGVNQYADFGVGSASP
jgi:hypothetical protein